MRSRILSSPGGVALGMLVACSCTVGPPPPPEPASAEVTIEVANRRPRDIEVFLVVENARHWLGVIPAQSRALKRIPREYRTANARFVVVDLESRPDTTRAVWFTPGFEFEMTITNGRAVVSAGVASRTSQEGRCPDVAAVNHRASWFF